MTISRRQILRLCFLLFALPAAIAVACNGADSDGAAKRSRPPARSTVATALGPDWRFAEPAQPAISSGGMVATDAALATKVGSDALFAGGNAVDAAVATAFALAVVHPRAGNIGGGGFAVVRMADGEVAALDFRERAPLAASRDMYLDESGEVSRESVTGRLAAGTPGSVAGLWELHQRYGTLYWNHLLIPAVRLAEEGFEADTSFCEAIRDEADRLARFPASADLFLPGGRPVEPGSVWRNPDLAAVLRRISAEGPAGFYEGETADLIVGDMKKGGGLISHEDLRSYEAVWREPIRFDYRGCEVISMPPPSSGGLTLALIAGILEGYDLGAMGWHSPEALHLTIEAMRRAFAYRNHYLGDPDFVEIPHEVFLSEESASRLRGGISLDRASPSSDISPGTGGAPEAAHTTHFSVVDAVGNAVALTTTINLSFGSAVTVEGAGFLLNNEMDDFAAKPGTPNAFGLVQGEANAIAPGKRMLSSMTPAIATRDGRTVAVTGASGGPRIITGVFQVLSNVIDYGLGIAEAVSAPRVHHQHLPDRVYYEKGGLTGSQISALEEMGHEVAPRSGWIAAAASVLKVGVYWTGAPDPRLGGAAGGP